MSRRYNPLVCTGGYAVGIVAIVVGIGVPYVYAAMSKYIILALSSVGSKQETVAVAKVSRPIEIE